MSDFFVLLGVKIDPGKAKLTGSRAMIRAVEHTLDCELVDVFEHITVGVRHEYIVCDIACDEVPSRNEYAIQYRERVAFVFLPHLKLPFTLALRKSFPETMHQNPTEPDSPKCLCLYDESESVTLMSWTEERHIQRTRWWITQASLGELHADDQTVEPLFFNPTTTIVIPHDLHVGLAAGRRVEVAGVKPQVGGGEKFFIKADWASGERNSGVKVNLLEITSAEITHGKVYSAPKNLQGLIQLFDSVGVGVVQLIRERLLRYVVSQEGDKQIEHTAFIVTLPIRRADSSPHEREQVIGFYCNKAVKEMLKDFEVVVVENGCLNQDADGNVRPMTAELPQFDIEPMEVLITLSSSNRREKSGYTSNLNKGLLIGAGALGATLLDIWVRGGWGRWTVIDEDIFRPHNFIRHLAPNFGMGKNKAVFCANFQNFSFDDAYVVGVNDDACKFAVNNPDGVFSEATLVVDASASLDYPREVSCLKQAPRHMSAFFAPSGNDAVLLVEDNRRKSRLSYLEAQYYRALIELPVGDRHFSKELSRFRSGVSCRDISTVMSHARVLSLSSLLADQIRLANECGDAQLLIWQDNLTTGDRQLTKVEVHKTKIFDDKVSSHFKVFWDEGVEAKLKEWRRKALPVETGGVLVGYHDMSRKHAYIVDALPAPPDSIGTLTTFDRGTEGVEDAIRTVASRTGGNISYIGEWHSHPKGTAAMSYLDRKQLDELAKSLSADGLPAFQMIVAQDEVRVNGKGVSRG